MLVTAILTLFSTLVTSAPLADLTVRNLPSGTTTTAGRTTTGGSTTTGSTTPSGSSIPQGSSKYYVGYWSAWHGTGEGVLPQSSQLKGLTHVILSFANMTDFAGYVESTNTQWDASTPAALRTAAGNPNLKVLAAMGGWGLDSLMRPGVQTPETREAFASKMMGFVERFQLDGLDMDWEYPVGNGANYKTEGPEGRPHDPTDIPNFTEFLKVLKGKLGTKVLSAAIPAKPGDMLAYTAESIPEMEKYIDFWNIMSYDFINRRDTTTGHHAGGAVIQKTIDEYLKRKMTPAKMVVGYPMYAKWFTLGQGTTCTAAKPIGCTMPPFEHANNGSDAGGSGAWMMNDALNEPTVSGMDPTLATKLKASWALAKAGANTEFPTEQASAFYDAASTIFWTWVSPKDISDSCAAAKAKGVGGIMTWSIDQDEGGAAGGPRFTAMQGCMA